MINKVMNKLSISVYKKQGNKLAIAEISKIDMTYRPDKTIGNIFYFNRINVPKGNRNKGVGTELLKALLSECKEQNIALLCEINPYGDLTYEQLKNWYKKHGFIEYNGVLWYL